MTATHYDRSAQDVGNLYSLEHVNLQIDDQGLATTFYVTGLGLTRDPYMMTGTRMMWINAGRNQFHLVQGPPQVVGGYIGLVMPDQQALLERLASVAAQLAGTSFSYAEEADYVRVVCPWGNRFRIHPPGPEWRRMTLGMPYIEIEVAGGTAQAIAKFYLQVVGAPATVREYRGATAACVQIGLGQELIFSETTLSLRPFDGHHIQVYVTNFSGLHRRLPELGLITEESNEHQYRFDTITDLQSGRALARVEHEVRSVGHPLFERPLINRNPAQSNVSYGAGLDAYVPPDTAKQMDDPRLRGMLAGCAAVDATGVVHAAKEPRDA